MRIGQFTAKNWRFMSDPNPKSSDILSDSSVKHILRPEIALSLQLGKHACLLRSFEIRPLERERPASAFYKRDEGETDSIKRDTQQECFELMNVYS